MGKWDEEFDKVLADTLAKKNSGKNIPISSKYSTSNSPLTYAQQYSYVNRGNTSSNLKSTVGSLSGKDDEKKDKKKKKKWYESGLFEDGYDFGDVSKTILGINEDSASLKDLTVNSFKKGYYNSIYGEESFKAMNGGKNNKDAYAELLAGDEYQFAPGNGFASAISGASELLGQQFRQFTNPRTLAIAGSAAGAAAIAGQSGPQILAPEEIVTVPAAAAAGFAAGSAASNLEIEAGHAYNEMLEAGIKEDTARKVATGVGAVNAGLEALQVDELLGAFKVVNKTGTTKSVAKKIAKELLDRGIDVAKETAQEVAQEGVTIAGVQAASKLQNDDWAYTKEDVTSRLLDTAKSSALSFGVMNVPAAAKNTFSIVRNQKNTVGPVQNEQTIPDKVVEQEKKIPAEEQKKVEPAVAEQVETPAEVKPKRALYTGSANTDIKQFKVGGVDGSKQTGDRYGRGIYLTTNENTAKNYAGENGRVYQTNVDELNIFDLNETITPEMRNSLISAFNGGDKQFRNSMLRNFRTEMTFDDFESAEAFFDKQRKVWKEQDGEYAANKPEIKSADSKTGKAVIEFTDFENWENNIGTLTGNHLYDALKSLSTDDFSSFITGHGFDGIAFDEDSNNQQYVIYRNEDRIKIDEDVAENATTDATLSETETVDTEVNLKDLYDQKQVLEDTLDSLHSVQDYGENFNTVSQRLADVENRIKSIEENSTEVKMDEASANDSSASPDKISADISYMVKDLINQDTGDLSLGKVDTFNVNGYTIRRRFLDDGETFDYTITTPNGRSISNRVEADMMSFYEDVEAQLESVMRDDSGLVSANDISAKGPVRVVSTEAGDYLKQDTFDAPQKQETKRARILTEMPEQPKTKTVKNTDSLDVSPKPEKAKLNPLKKFGEFVADNGFVFERLGKRTKNRELEAKWDGLRRTRSAAQHLIGKGLKYDGVKSLKSMMETAEKAGLTEDFYNYLAHYRNIDGMTLDTRFNTYNRGVFGDVSAAESQFEADRLEKLHPEFKEWAEDVYAYNNYLRDKMVEGRLISQKTADLLAEMYPHYVPIRRVGMDGLTEMDNTNHVGVDSPLKSATGGNQDIMPLFETMADRTMAVYRAVAMNKFGLELFNTLYPGRLNTNAYLDPDASNVSFPTGDVDVDYSLEGFDPREDLLQSGTPGSLPNFSIFVDGERHTFDINEEMYVAMKPTSDWLSVDIPGLSQLSNLRRNLITAYSPWFTLKNGIKDFQEIMVNSQHPLKTYATLFESAIQLATKGTKYQEYIENGGEHITYFDTNESTFDGKKTAEDVMPLKQILKANNFIETLPRLAEFIASRAEGRSVEVSMLDAARVTTNFGAGGKFAKLLDRNGCTFLNSSIQGFIQHGRNVVEASQNGLKGWAGLAARYLALGLPAVLLNKLIWEDDEDYQALPDYISNNYYVVWKYGDGQFIRIPKGRTAAVMQDLIEQVAKQSSGDDEADWNNFFKLFFENMAPNNPLEDNVFAPIIQTLKGKTWYGEDIIPYRLKDLEPEEQFDEKTDSLSIKLGEKLSMSPKKINYLLDQYSGVVGDTILPYMTPKAESPIDNPALKAIAPLRDIFTTDSTLNNRVTGDFYDTLEGLEAKAESEDATTEDKFKSSLLIGYNAEISKLMKEQREIQTSDLPDSEKYKRNRELKKEINALQKEGLEALNDYRIDGVYAEAGGKRFNFGYDTENEVDRWFEIKPQKADGTDNYYYQQEQRITKDLGISSEEYWNNREMYDDFYYVAGGYDKDSTSDDTIETARAVFGYERFAEYAKELKNIKADKDKDGNSISGTRYKKVQTYIDTLDIPDIEKKILYTMQYPNYKKYKGEIVKYLDQNDDISYQSFYKILDELGYTVRKDGKITWN